MGSQRNISIIGGFLGGLIILIGGAMRSLHPHDPFDLLFNATLIFIGLVWLKSRAGFFPLGETAGVRDPWAGSTPDAGHYISSWVEAPPPLQP
jgi:hypothetical protein